MDDVATDVEAHDYALHLEYTRAELQRRLDQDDSRIQATRPLHANAPLSADARSRVLRTALVDATDSAPFLPSAGSVLPALLALRKTHQTIVDTEAYLAAQAAERERLRKQLEADRAVVRDQRLLTDALNARVVSLRAQLAAEPAALPDGDRVERQLKDLAAQKRGYDKETSRLMRALLAFIDNQLAPMLAAEELGGPVVGDVLDVDPDDLAAGFTARGKPKKTRNSAGTQDARQRRLDEVWGTGGPQARRHGNDKDDDDVVSASGLDMRQLVEELLNTLVEAKGDTAASYVTLGQESAAARFLVRSKVAQLHPKDAMRLRLVDFGRELGG